MADSKVTELVEITTTAEADAIPIVDVSVPATRRISRINLGKSMVFENVNIYDLNQAVKESDLVIAASAVAFDFEDNGNCALTVDENVTISAATGITAGVRHSALMHVTMDSTGGYTFAWNAAWKDLGEDISVNDGASESTFYFLFSDGTNSYVWKLPGVE